MKRYIYIIALTLPTLAFAQVNQQSLLADEYYINGELEKAKNIYEKLATNKNNIPQIHNNYFTIMLALADFKATEKYIKKTIKLFPANVYYKIDQGILFEKIGDYQYAHKVFEEVIESSQKNKYQIRTTAQYFIYNKHLEYALKSYQAGRKNDKDNASYALELANTYRLLGRKNEMIEEYLTFASIRFNNVKYVKNILQNLLQQEDEIQVFQNILIEKIQRHPNEILYSELLIWSSLQRNDFHIAFIQACAIDKKNRSNGTRSMSVGRIALENKAYDDAIEIYSHVAKNFPKTGNYIVARRQIIKSREEKVKNKFPVEISAIRELTSDYQQLILDIGLNAQTIEAYRNKALLHAFYLNELDSAISILNKIIRVPRVSQSLKSKSKLDLGDIYLLIDEPWESTLLYSQVEKGNRDSPMAYMAKLKNAKLNYFKGNFELTKSHLDILKLATTREIANDALELSLLIQDNTALDSSDFVMKEYASIELMIFQNKNDSVLIAFGDMIKKYPGHSLTDEIYLKMANINLKLGYFENALLQLQAIQLNYPTDILGDDAMFLSAEIYEIQLSDKESAMNLYRDFMTKYPGSIFVSEARKRFRQLRGDNIN